MCRIKDVVAVFSVVSHNIILIIVGMIRTIMLQLMQDKNNNFCIVLSVITFCFVM